MTIQENRHHFARILAKTKRNKPYLETTRLLNIHAKSHNPCSCAICKVSRIRGFRDKKLLVWRNLMSLNTRSGLPAKIYERLPEQLFSIMGAIYEDNQWRPCYVNRKPCIVHKLDLMINLEK